MSEQKGCYWCIHRKGMKCDCSSANMKQFFDMYPKMKKLNEFVMYEDKLIFIGCKCGSFEHERNKDIKVIFT